MDDYQVIDLGHEHGAITALTLWFADSEEIDFDSGHVVADCVVTKAQVEIGNWSADLDRPALIQMIGKESIKAYEDERAALLEMQEIAA